jgi:hypothetical protein
MVPRKTVRCGEEIPLSLPPFGFTSLRNDIQSDSAAPEIPKRSEE